MHDLSVRRRQSRLLLGCLLSLAAVAVATPAFAAPDCKETCVTKSKEFYDDCILLGGAPLDCQTQANQLEIECYSLCPTTSVGFPLVMCVELETTTSSALGNGFPWENSAFFFSDYRNQYLYPSTTVADLLTSGVTTLESIHARAVSFSGASSNVYGVSPLGEPSTVSIYNTSVTTLNHVYADNITEPAHGSIVATVSNPIVIRTIVGPRGSLLSTCASCPSGDGWFDPIDLATVDNLLMDQTMKLGVGNSGDTIWDSTSTDLGGGCAGPERAFGSGSFVNPAFLTSALGIDNHAFVWVFAGKAPGKFAGLQQHVTDTLQILLRPEAVERHLGVQPRTRPPTGPTTEDCVRPVVPTANDNGILVRADGVAARDGR